MPIYLILDAFFWGNPSENLKLAKIFEILMSKIPFCRWGSEAQSSHVKVKARSNQVSHEWEWREEKI